MGQIRHGSASTTHAVRADIQRSQASIAELSRELAINPKTVAKWRKRQSVEDQKTGPKDPRSTVLSEEEEAMVVAAADGLTNKEIAKSVGFCATTVGIWRNRFAERRMDGLYDEPRPGAPRQIGDDEIAETIRKTLETVPEGRTHWSSRAMAREIGHAPSTVQRNPLTGSACLHAREGGKPLACNRIGPRRSSCRQIRSLLRNCATLSGSI